MLQRFVLDAMSLLEIVVQRLSRRVEILVGISRDWKLRVANVYRGHQMKQKGEESDRHEREWKKFSIVVE